MSELNQGPLEKLAMLDEHGQRQFIIPAEVRGFFHKWKKRVHLVLMLIFLSLPWIQIGGHQAVLLDLPNREFFFFGLHLQAYDAPLFFFIVFGFAISLALATALFGRVWCGWACPQTVFIESIYREIEKLTEGTYLARRKLRQQSWSFEKIRKTALKWILYVLVSSVVAHSFIAYWAGAENLLEMMARPPADNFNYFLLVSGVTALLVFNFGWFREQFCMIVCPYGRFQSVLMDSNSVTVMYDTDRGEPRKGRAPTGETKGDCVGCNRCVQVCPTGIDIRNGLQFECIACTACMDACDEIMAKVKKPTGLIRYRALTRTPVNWFRPRVLAYGAVVLACAVSLITLLAMRNPVRFEIFRAKDTPYHVTAEGVVRNHFVLKVENHKSVASRISVSTKSPVKLILPENPMELSVNAKQVIPVFVEAAQSEFKFGRLNVEIQVQDDLEGRTLTWKRISILGPLTSGGADASR